jgi:pyrroloquinoline quinone biosynthesis protein B
MKIRVLGSSAGGGFPQWNCNCRNCSGVRNRTIAAEPRTQSSLAVSVDDHAWLLINASPDILAQLAANPELQPARHARDTGIAAVLLMDAQIDHVTGLLMLREHNAPLPIYTTDAVWQDLSTGFPVASILSHYCGVEHHTIALDDAPLEIAALPGVHIEALPLSSKAPPYSPHRTAPERGDNIGLLITALDSGKRAFYGTMWTNDEMIQLGLSKKTAADMGHLAQSGPGGMIDVLDALDRPGARKVLIHINNTNPILVDDGPERRTLTQHGIEVARDGMTFEL